MMKAKLSEKYRRAPTFLTIEKYLREPDQPAASHPEARNPRIVPLVIFDYGSIWARLKQFRYVGKLLISSVSEMSKSASSIKDNPYAGKKHIDSATLQEFENYVKSLGVTDIGYTPVNPRYIFNGYRILFKNAIVFTMEMDKDKINQSPSISSFIEIFRTYHQLGVTVNKAAEFLRQRGFNAHAGPALGGDANYIPIARDAGLGEVGKNGLLITKSNGPRVRLAAVYTDIENLPFPEDNPHKWIRDYCDKCNLCIKKCPADAIYSEPEVLSDGGPTFVDHTKCAKPFSNDNGCTLCIKYCPFSNADYDTFKKHIQADLGI